MMLLLLTLCASQLCLGILAPDGMYRIRVSVPPRVPCRVEPPFPCDVILFSTFPCYVLMLLSNSAFLFRRTDWRESRSGVCHYISTAHDNKRMQSSALGASLLLIPKLTTSFCCQQNSMGNAWGRHSAMDGALQPFLRLHSRRYAPLTLCSSLLVFLFFLSLYSPFSWCCV